MSRFHSTNKRLPVFGERNLGFQPFANPTRTADMLPACRVVIARQDTGRPRQAGTPIFELRFHPLDVGAELAQLFVEMFVATIDVINAAHFRCSLRLQSCQNQRG